MGDTLCDHDPSIPDPKLVQFEAIFSSKLSKSEASRLWAQATSLDDAVDLALKHLQDSGVDKTPLNTPPRSRDRSPPPFSQNSSASFLPFSSPLGRRLSIDPILTYNPSPTPPPQPKLHVPKNLPDDFLRIPTSHAIKINLSPRTSSSSSNTTPNFTWLKISDADAKVRSQHSSNSNSNSNFNSPSTIHENTSYNHFISVLHRDPVNPSSGLGMTVREHKGSLFVHALNSLASSTSSAEVGDLIRGVGTTAFLGGKRLTNTEEEGTASEVLKAAVLAIVSTPDPVLLHLTLASKQIVAHGSGEIIVTKFLKQYTFRARLWEASGGRYLKVGVNTSIRPDGSVVNNGGGAGESKFGKVGDFKKVVAINAGAGGDNFVTQTADSDSDSDNDNETNNKTNNDNDNDPAICVYKVRKHLCIRIIGTVNDNNNDQVTYKVWTFDVARGEEWTTTSPKSFLDFQKLRVALGKLRPSIGQIQFPKDSFFSISDVLNGSNISGEARRSMLEKFLRKVSSLLFTSNLHPNSYEIALELQRFLDANPTGAISPEKTTKSKTEIFTKAIQCYCARIFLLPQLDSLIVQFIENCRANSPTNAQLIAMVNAKGHEELKRSAEQQLSAVRSFLEKLENLILNGCLSDIVSIAEFYEIDTDKTDFSVTENNYVRTAIRTQIEVEVYVPLRSLLSKAIVNGWRFEDVIVGNKMKSLREGEGKHQSFYKIGPNLVSSSGWKSACAILAVGSRRTLPCEKLEAILSCAAEIFRLNKVERGDEGEASETHLGADDFLPIFIYVVVHSNIDRPLSLLSLLDNICNSISKQGEAGYYLATFEAACTHLKMMVEEEKEKEFNLEEAEEKAKEKDPIQMPLGLEFEPAEENQNASIQTVTENLGSVLQQSGFLA